MSDVDRDTKKLFECIKSCGDEFDECLCTFDQKPNEFLRESPLIKNILNKELFTNRLIEHLLREEERIPYIFESRKKGTYFKPPNVPMALKRCNELCSNENIEDICENNTCQISVNDYLDLPKYRGNIPDNVEFGDDVKDMDIHYYTAIQHLKKHNIITCPITHTYGTQQQFTCYSTRSLPPYKIHGEWKNIIKRNVGEELDEYNDYIDTIMEEDMFTLEEQELLIDHILETELGISYEYIPYKELQRDLLELVSMKGTASSLLQDFGIDFSEDDLAPVPLEEIISKG